MKSNTFKRFITKIIALCMAATCLVTTAFGETNTYQGQYEYGGSTVGYFSVGGYNAFCIEHSKKTVQTGMNVTTQRIYNPSLSKVLYYGWGGQGQWSGFTSSSAGITTTSMLASNYYSGSGDRSFTMYQQFKTYVTAQSLVGDGYVTIATPNDSSYQTLALQMPVTSSSGGGGGATAETISFSIKKTSANPSLTNDNSCYSLAGCVVALYKNDTDRQNDRNRIATLTTNANGISNTATISTYASSVAIYAREIQAPKGMALSTDVIGVLNAAAGRSYTLTIEDEPLNDPITILLTKRPTLNGVATAPIGSLEGAEYTIRYYSGQYATAAEAEVSGAPMRTWIYATDAEGKIKFADETQKVGGDALYYINGTTPTIPLGTVLIQETKAPTSGAYFIDETIYVRNITQNGEGVAVVGAENEGIVNEEVAVNPTLQIQKVDAMTQEPIAVADIGFKLYNPDGTQITSSETDIFYTDENGTINVPVELPYGTNYSAVEQNAPTGYVLPQEPILFDISAAITEKIEDNFIAKLTIANTPTKIAVQKVDGEGNSVIGATLQLINGEDTVVREWTSAETPEIFYQLPIGGSYKIHEVSAPDGYISIKNDIDFVVSDTSEMQTINVTNEQSHISIKKVDEEGNAISGVTLQLFDKNDTLVREWVSGENAEHFYGLQIGGVYHVHENATPAGYASIKEDLQFTVGDTNETQNISIVNVKTTVSVNKTDKYGETLPGASLQLIDENDAVVKEWTSGDEAEVFRGLLVGKNYRVHEVSAPSGYFTNEEDIEFTVNDTSEVQDILVENETMPTIGTTATVDDAKFAPYNSKITIDDVVTYENLIPGETYTITGKLMDHSTGEPLLDKDGNEVVGTKTFVCAERNGTVTITFNFDTTELSGKKVVAYEFLYKKGFELTTHTDIDSEPQSVGIMDAAPSIKTTATVNGEHEFTTTGDKFTLVDKVEYEHLIPDKDYVLKGTIMDKSTGKEFLDKDGNKITSSISFTTKSFNGSVDMEFTIDAPTIRSDTKLVVFEMLYYKDAEIATDTDVDKPATDTDVGETATDTDVKKSELASHTDINDEGQTVTILRTPSSIKTTATVKEKHEVKITGEKVTLTDVVKYENLIKGVEYKIKGTIMDKLTGKEYLGGDGKEISIESTFTPTESSDSTTLSFTIDTSKMNKDTSLVVFETLYLDGKEVATHNDVNDKDQTVTFKKASATPAKTGDEGIMTYAVMASISAAATVLLTIIEKNKKQQKARIIYTPEGGNIHK